jgi:hypothetical protein
VNALMLLALAMTNDTPPDPMRDAFIATIEKMKLPGMEVEPLIIPCGQVNAAYISVTHQIVMCAETFELGPDVVRFVTAHEMAHAIIDQYNIPVPGSEEGAADELAAVYFGMTGDALTILKAGVFWAEHPDAGENVWDDHQSSRKRAAVLMCLGDGANEDAAIHGCRVKFLKAEQTWTRLVQAFGPKPEQ